MDKKNRIMAAAEELFRTGQYHEITLDEVIRRANVGKGTVYQHFASKEDLFFQTALAAFDTMCEMLRKDVATDSPLEHRLGRACRAICQFARERRPLFRLLHAEGEKALSKGGGLRERWNEHRKKMTCIIADIFRTGVERGEVRRDIAADVLAEYFLGLVRARFNEVEELRRKGRGEATLVSLFVHGLAPVERTGSAAGRRPRRESP